MLKNIYLKTLRDARLGILLWGSVLALIAGIDLVLISHIYDHQRAGIEAIKAAMQSGELAAHNILRRIEGRATKPFRYRNKGDLATIGSVLDG